LSDKGGPNQENSLIHDTGGKLDHNNSVMLLPMPKIKPVKVIPSGKRRNSKTNDRPQAGGGSLRHNIYMPNVPHTQAPVN
jgi:hypothetical protein